MACTRSGGCSAHRRRSSRTARNTCVLAVQPKKWTGHSRFLQSAGQQVARRQRVRAQAIHDRSEPIPIQSGRDARQASFSTAHIQFGNDERDVPRPVHSMRLPGGRAGSTVRRFGFLPTGNTRFTGSFVPIIGDRCLFGLLPLRSRAVLFRLSPAFGWDWPRCEPVILKAGLR